MKQTLVQSPALSMVPWSPSGVSPNHRAKSKPCEQLGVSQKYKEETYAPRSGTVSSKQCRQIPIDWQWGTLLRRPRVKTMNGFHIRTLTEKTNEIKHPCWQGCAKKEAFPHCWRDQCLTQPLWITVSRCHQNIKLELSYDPEIPSLAQGHKKINSIWHSMHTYLPQSTFFSIFKANNQWQMSG